MKVTEHNGLDINLIKSECGSKYSPNLYRWLTSKTDTHRAWVFRVYRDTIDDTLWIGILEAAS